MRAKGCFVASLLAMTVYFTNFSSTLNLNFTNFSSTLNLNYAYLHRHCERSEAISNSQVRIFSKNIPFLLHI